ATVAILGRPIAPPRRKTIVVHEAPVVIHYVTRQIMDELAYLCLFLLGLRNQIVVGRIKKVVTDDFVRTRITFPKVLPIGRLRPTWNNIFPQWIVLLCREVRLFPVSDIGIIP